MVSNKVEIIYSDLALYDPVVHTNEKAVLESVINLLQTNANERFFAPDAYIPWDDLIANLKIDTYLKYYEKIIEDQIPLHEPRIKKVYCTISENPNENHSINIDIQLELVTGEQIKELLTVFIGD